MSDQLLYNPWVLFGLGIGAVCYLIQFICTKNLEFVALFLCFGAIASVFSRNMVVIIVMSIFATEMVRLSRHGLNREGLENQTDEIEINESELELSDDTKESTTKDSSTNESTAKTASLSSKDKEKLDSIQKQIDTLQTEVNTIKQTLA